MSDKISATVGNLNRKGRPKGAINKTTRAAKDAIAFVFDDMGGAEAMAVWAKSNDDNKKAFYTSIYPKLLPLQVGGDPENPLNISATVRKIVDAARN